MGLVFPLALLTSLKLAMNTTPYLPGASAAAVPPVAPLPNPWPPVLSPSPFRRAASAAAAASPEYDEGAEDQGAPRQVEQRADPAFMDPRHFISALRPSGSFVVSEPTYEERDPPTTAVDSRGDAGRLYKRRR